MNARRPQCFAMALLLACALAAQQDAAAHWAFAPVVRPPLPSGTANGIANGANPIDAFVGARLAKEGLALAPSADRATLMRRLWLVVLGVPPTPEDVATFVADPATDAWPRLVDRALADPRYGERWARHWLDVVRFAETNGFETNRERANAWHYRDWVIDALNRDLPYDAFVRAQLCGDLHGEDAATGFLVGGPVDIVGSPDPVLTAQQRADQLDDLVATTGSAFLGLSIGCARCHDHKFDPIPQRDYYALCAVFDGVRHGERALPSTPERGQQLADAERRLRSLETLLAAYRVAPPVAVAAGTPLRPAVDFARNEERFAPVTATAVRMTIFATTGAEPCLDELEVFAGETNVALAANGTVASASGTLPGFAIHQLAHLNDGRGGNEHSWISDEAGGGLVVLAFAQPQRIERIVWGRDRTGGFRDRLALQYRFDARGDDGQWREVASSADRAPRAGVTATAAEERHDFDAADPAEASRARGWLAARAGARDQCNELRQGAMAYAGTFVAAGPTHRLHRGDPMQPRDVVAPATLSLWSRAELAADAPEAARRRALADWIADARNPLTARVAVNRVWQHQFGTGLVASPSDFGKNGARPSHPELLDWLAAEFVARGWSIKALQRAILTSRTWQQANAPVAAGLRIDAGDRLLWRFPPRRLEAEAIRDSMLAVSGLLDSTRGGPGFSLFDVDRENVYHYHPKATFGPAEARRMIYALKVRMEQDAVFGAFDCPDGSLVQPRRSRSTTPLQALNLLNSGFVLQQAAALAARAQRDMAGSDASAAIARAWQLVYQRAPTADEAADALTLVQAQGLPALCRALLASNEFLFVP